jgi:ABC-2 type transport system permease protein
MRAFAAHFSFELRTGVRDRALLFMNYLLPLVFYVMMGLLMIPLNPPFRETLIPVMVVFAIVSSTIIGMPNPLVAAREAGIFRSFKINGVPAFSILLMPALSTAIHMIVVAIIITATAPLLFSAPLPMNWGFYIGVILSTIIGCAGVGVLIGVVSANSRVMLLVSQFIFLPSMLIGGLMIPATALPPFLGRVGMFLPTTYAMDAFKNLAWSTSVDVHPLFSLVVLLSTGLLAFGLASFLFSWDNKNSARRGHPLLALIALLPCAVGAIFL